MPKVFRKKRYVRRKRKPFSKKQVKTIKKISERRSELKMHNVSGSTATTGGFEVNLSAVSQGDTILTREGDRIEPTSLKLNYRIIRDAGVAADTVDAVRVLIIQWHPDTLVDAPQLSDVLQDASTVTQQRVSPITGEVAKRARFTLLYDRIHDFIYDRSHGKDSVAMRNLWFNLTKKARVLYNTGGATTGKNHIYLLVAGQQVVATEDSTFTYYSQLRFRDQ